MPNENKVCRYVPEPVSDEVLGRRGEERVVEPHIESLLGEHVGDLGEAGEGEVNAHNTTAKNAVTRIVVNSVIKWWKPSLHSSLEILIARLGEWHVVKNKGDDDCDKGNS